MTLACFIVGLVFSFAGVQNHVSGFLVDDLDFARSVILDAAKDITTKPTIKRTRVIRPFESKSVTTSTHLKKITFRTRRKVIKPKKVYKYVAKPRNLNKFNEVMDQVERAMTQAQLSRRQPKLAELKRHITNAVKRGNVRYARRALGLAFYTARQQSSKRGRGKRAASFDAKKFLADIKSSLGKEQFSDFLALRGEVTLMFAIDITGSMREEIAAAKSIATEITKMDRSEPVDYILSTFGDPISQGSVVYKNESAVDQFIKSINDLDPKRGGDCPEFTYEGMINALYEDPRFGSPLYVFTDATPKDANDENKETLQVLLEDLGATVNFFVHKSCGSADKYLNFKEVAESNGGQFLKLTEKEMKNVSKFTASALGGATAVASGTSKSARRKRGSSGVTVIAIPVDETVSRVVISVTTEGNTGRIYVNTPTGAKWTRGINTLSNVVIYNINSPTKGIWKLFIPSTVGQYEYSAKVNSLENVDFEHYFTIKERKKIVPVRNPFQDGTANAHITVSGVNKVQRNSLLVDIIDISGKVLKPNNKLTKVGKTGLRFVLTFQPPGVPFKLMLKGKTTGNKYFQRISRHVDDAKSLILKEFYTSKYYTLKKGGKTSVFLNLFNNSFKDLDFILVFKDTFKCAIGYRGGSSKKILKVKKRNKRILIVNVNCKNGNEVVGKTENVIIMVKDVKGNIMSTEIVPLMII